ELRVVRAILDRADALPLARASAARHRDEDGCGEGAGAEAEEDGPGDPAPAAPAPRALGAEGLELEPERELLARGGHGEALPELSESGSRRGEGVLAGREPALGGKGAEGLAAHRDGRARRRADHRDAHAGARGPRLERLLHRLGERGAQPAPPDR